MTCPRCNGFIYTRRDPGGEMFVSCFNCGWRLYQAVTIAPRLPPVDEIYIGEWGRSWRNYVADEPVGWDF